MTKPVPAAPPSAGPPSGGLRGGTGAPLAAPEEPQVALEEAGQQQQQRADEAAGQCRALGQA